MKKYLILITIITLANLCRAQNRHSVTARLIDTNTRQPVELATIAILSMRDSSLISYTITDKQGVFTLRNLRELPLMVRDIDDGAKARVIVISSGRIVADETPAQLRSRKPGARLDEVFRELTSSDL